MNALKYAMKEQLTDTTVTNILFGLAAIIVTLMPSSMLAHTWETEGQKVLNDTLIGLGFWAALHLITFVSNWNIYRDAEQPDAAVTVANLEDVTVKNRRIVEHMFYQMPFLTALGWIVSYVVLAGGYISQSIPETGAFAFQWGVLVVVWFLSFAMYMQHRRKDTEKELYPTNEVDELF